MFTVSLGGSSHIQFIEKWIDIYYDIAYVIDDDYLPSLQDEFSYAQRINSAISQSAFEQARQIIDDRNTHYRSCLCKYNSDDMRENLRRISLGWKTLPAWDEVPENIAKIKEIKEQYIEVFENFINNQIIRCHSISEFQIEDDLFHWLDRNTYFQNITERRIFSRAFNDIYFKYRMDRSTIDPFDI